MLIGSIPFGMIYGVLAVGAGIPPVLAQAMSVIVFAGGAQFVTAQLVGAGLPAVVIIVTIFVLNLRHALYSASLVPYTRYLSPIWKWAVAYFLVDEAYAATIGRWRQGGGQAHWYYLGAGLGLWVNWQISTAIGIFLGAQIPAAWALDFALPLTFMGLVIPTLTDRAIRVTAVVAGVVAVLLFGLPYKLGLLLAALIAMGVGLWTER
jgi:4-azaleucine resistance transporter AzlC